MTRVKRNLFARHEKNAPKAPFGAFLFYFFSQQPLQAVLCCSLPQLQPPELQWGQLALSGQPIQ